MKFTLNIPGYKNTRYFGIDTDEIVMVNMVQIPIINLSLYGVVVFKNGRTIFLSPDKTRQILDSFLK